MIPEIEVEFRLIGTEILPDEITQQLGMNPTSTWLEGDYVPKTKLRLKENGWALASIGPEQTYELSDYIVPLIDTLLPKSTLIVELCEKYHLYSELSVGVYIRDETPSINLDQTIISGLEELKTTIDIDLILLPRS